MLEPPYLQVITQLVIIATIKLFFFINPQTFRGEVFNKVGCVSCEVQMLVRSQKQCHSAKDCMTCFLLLDDILFVGFPQTNILLVPIVS